MPLNIRKGSDGLIGPGTDNLLKHDQIKVGF